MEYFLRVMTSLVKATPVTLSIFFFTLIFSLPLGWLLSLVRVSRSKPASKLVELYCWIMRGTPLLLQLIFVYFGLPFIWGGITLSGFQVAILTFSLNYAAYFAEIFRGGIQSISRGQYEAADVLGLSRSQTMFRIVLPQAFKRVLPSVGNEVITLVKDTSLAYILTLQDVLRVAQIAVVRDFRSEALLGAAIIYLIMSYLATKFVAFVEHKFAYYE